MKKTLSLILLTSVILACTGCNNDNDRLGEDSSDISLSSEETLPPETANNTEASESEREITDPEDINHDNPRVDYTKEEVSEIINANSNFKADKDIYVSAPKSIDHISEFYERTPAQPSPKESLKEFSEIFKYLFPDHELDMDCLYYYRWSEDEDPNADVYETRFHCLSDKDKYNVFMNELSGDWEIGGHASYLIYDEVKKPNKNSIHATLRMPFGSDLCIFNKGLGQRIGKKIKEGEKYNASEHFFPEEYFEFVREFPPDSEEVFKLYDKEISIKDAVNFFESYIEEAPTSAKQACKIHVNAVNVYKMDEVTYCYQFLTSKQYDGIHFDYSYDGTRRPDDNRDLSLGVMVRSDDVDYVYGTFKASTIIEETVHKEFISFEEAVKIASEKLTEYVDFQVNRAELMYCSKANIGEYWLGQTKYPIYPAWKLTLSNPNDDLIYTAYVNALTGEFTTYHS